MLTREIQGNRLLFTDKTRLFDFFSSGRACQVLVRAKQKKRKDELTCEQSENSPIGSFVPTMMDTKHNTIMPVCSACFFTFNTLRMRFTNV